MTAFALALLLSSLPPPGSVVLGLSTTEGVETEIVVVAPSGEREVLGVLTHARGHVPKGVVAGSRLFTVSRVPDGAAGVLEETRLETGARRLLLTSVMTTQAPALDAEGGALVVRQDGERAFSIVRADATPLARLGASWVTPARGAPATFLVVDGVGGLVGDGAGTRVITLAGSAAAVRATLGAGSFRAPVVRGAATLVERALPGGRAEVVSFGADGASRVIARGLRGMDPAPCGADVVLGAGEKRAALVVLDGVTLRPRARLVAERAGVASPRACAMVGGAPVAVAWLDRGASLPGELWRITQAGAAPLVAPGAGVAVEVYGFIDDARPVQR